MPSALANFYNSTRGARKVIVVDLGFLGDTVHLVPALWEIKRHYPRAELHVLTTPVGGEVLALMPCVDRAWPVEMDPAKRTLRQQWQVVRALRRERFDAAFNFSGADRTVFMTALTGARRRVAHAAARRHFWNSWLIPDWIPQQDRQLPVFEQRRQVLARCGLELAPARFDLKISEPARQWAATHVPAGAIHFSINASTHLKEWPLEHWIALAKQLAQGRNEIRIVATGSASPRERDRLDAFLSAVGSPGLRILSGLSIAQLAALLTRCALHVGADSGVLHLAMALGVPTVSLFREYPGLKEWLPRGPQHRHLTVPCPCVSQRRPACLAKEVARCLARLAPETVAAIVRERLAG
jgi:ADP-heptose:LPS heptosyltransferase